MIGSKNSKIYLEKRDQNYDTRKKAKIYFEEKKQKYD